MKKTKRKIFLKFVLVLDLFLIFGFFFMFKPFSAAYADLADGNVNLTYPYSKTFIISAYYSPLPCQNSYFKGSYEADMRLNGGGKGADGHEVYPGMIAAPKTYQFGTKMHIPGIGIVTVHDRGGAIVAAGVRSNQYDRLDIWMGYGDKGMARALDWGKRTVEVVVYGVDDTIMEQVQLGDYSASEATPNDCSMIASKPSTQQTNLPVKGPENLVVASVKKNPEINTVLDSLKLMSKDLKSGDSGDEVRVLQQQLARLNLYRAPVNGKYDEITKHVVFKFQQTQGLVLEEDSPYAGVFGAKTRKRLNSLVASYNYSQKKIAQSTDRYQKIYVASLEANKPRKTLLSFQLKPGMRGKEVADLQKFLMSKGFFDGNLITQYYGPVTEKAVVNFQKANNLIGSSGDSAAGHVGPATLELINSLS